MNVGSGTERFAVVTEIDRRVDSSQSEEAIVTAVVLTPVNRIAPAAREMVCPISDLEAWEPVDVEEAE